MDTEAQRSGLIEEGISEEPHWSLVKERVFIHPRSCSRKEKTFSFLNNMSPFLRNDPQNHPSDLVVEGVCWMLQSTRYLNGGDFYTNKRNQTSVARARRNLVSESRRQPVEISRCGAWSIFRWWNENNRGNPKELLVCGLNVLSDGPVISGPACVYFSEKRVEMSSLSSQGFFRSSP